MREKLLSQHWHFYQPRGNDVWASIIDEQCYKPNSENGILRDISFNIGPTLIEWFERNDPNTLERMVSADRGQVIAQPYNHRILPLIRYEEDLKTQVRWGKEHFKRYFNRSPRGMWLPEAATDTRTCNALVDEGIEYTLGAWWQGKTEDGGRIDPSDAYNVDLGDGKSICYLFYHPVSAEIAFNSHIGTGLRFLDNADMALEALIDKTADDPLVLLAYDGETFGHHHRLADHWAGYFPRAVEKRSGVAMLTPDQYIDYIGAKSKALIEEKSSWSCLCGGLKRWTEGCNCAGGKKDYQSTLLAVLESQEDKVHDLFSTYAGKALRDPWAARDDYIHVLIREETFEEMIARHLKRYRTREGISALKGLFEAEYLTQLSFTSCGWFFPEINIQTKNNIRDAYSASKKIRDSIGHDISPPLAELDWMLDRPD